MRLYDILSVEVVDLTAGQYKRRIAAVKTPAAITPSEAAMIAADVATKSANVSIGFVDRFNGSLVITGDVAAVQSALTEVMNTLCGMMGFASAPITKT